MKALKAIGDPFVIATLLALCVSAHTYYVSFLNRDFPTFTTEEEIGEAIQREFPLFVDYL